MGFMFDALMNDSELDDLLRASAQDPPLPQGFRSEVWTRIASIEDSSFAILGRRLMEFVVRPVPAVIGVVGTLALGIVLGLASPSISDDDGMKYAESISPFLREHTP